MAAAAALAHLRAAWTRHEEPPRRAAPIDLRSASLPELRALPGLGPRRAVDFARARWRAGLEAFSPEEVRGIGPRTARGLREATLRPRAPEPP